ncbi:actin-associated protein FAM107A isoform X2 [Bombina bombina]|uniref:actin-associated protein FAM107A isoform X2 n=1 Tax=Bombina bombina TaxID=8345 RepID=UPI00235A8DB7|nr:actin-associated protein FAM107A isoform X2 [Bombina bombina]
MSQELWMWAKCQVLSSLRLPIYIGAMLPTLKKVSIPGKDALATGKEGSSDLVSDSSLPKFIPPCKPDNPLKSSRTHQELHKELLLTYRKGLVLHSKPELLQVLEKRRTQERESKDPEHVIPPLEKELQKWQQRREEREQESTRNDVSGVHEFLRVRENLRKSSKTNPNSPPPPVS